MKVDSIGVKKIRKFLRNCPSNVEVYQLLAQDMRNTTTQAPNGIDKVYDQVMKQILRKHGDRFQDDLPHGLQPKRSVEHDIVVDEEASASHQIFINYHPMN